MARGYIVRYQSSDGKVGGERRFGGLPIRIGRNTLNDCSITTGYVSDFHARVEEADGRLSVRDLGSTNGVFLPDGQRTPRQTCAYLAPPAHEFLVSPYLRFSVEVVDDVPPLSVRNPKFEKSVVLGNVAMLLSGVQEQPERPPAPVATGSPRGGPLAERLPLGMHPTPLIPGNRGPDALPDLPPLPPASRPPTGVAPYPMGGMAPVAQPAPLPPLPGAAPAAFVPAAPRYPAYAAEPHAPAAPGIPQGTNQFTFTPELLAYIGLKELAASLVPGVPLDTTGDVARLVTKLHDAIDVFCRSFLPLRDGYTQFVSSMDLQRAFAQRTMHRSQAFLRVETARDPATVAAALLDFHDPSPDAATAVEGIFADLMLHQLGLLDGVMRGVRALLDELSPAAIETAVDESDQRLPLGIGKTKALWQMYRDKYEQLAEEKEAFSRIFGAEFAEAYREYQRRRPGRSGNP